MTKQQQNRLAELTRLASQCEPVPTVSYANGLYTVIVKDRAYLFDDYRKTVGFLTGLAAVSY